MSSVINTNIAALNAQRNLGSTQTALQTSLQRLSSGLRINSAKDDAAGLAISSRMTSQINGNMQAARNANDGISLAQTAEGDLAQIGVNLQRMRELAVQSANATNSASDRASLNSEVLQLAAEIDRVSQNSSFNGVKLLDGSFTTQNFQVGAGATANDSIAIHQISSARTSQIGGAGTTTAARVTGGLTTAGLLAGSVTLNGFQVGASAVGALPGQNTASATSIATAINATTGSSGVTATANASSAVGLATTAFAKVLADQFSINGVSVGEVAAGTDAIGKGANVAAAINLVSGQSGVTAVANATTGAVTLNAADGRNISVTANNSPTDTTPGVGYTSVELVANTGFAHTLSDTVTGAAVATAGVVTATVNGVVVTGVTGGTSVLTSAENFVTAFNNAAGLSANALTLAGITASNDSLGVITLKSNGTQASMALTAGLTAGFDAVQAAATFTSQKGSVSLSSSNVNGIVLSGGSPANGGFVAATTAATTVSNVTSVSSVNISSAAGALSALATIDGAIASINSSRASLGAFQNRFASVVVSLQTTSENLTASRSRIMDTDFAAETSNLTKNQILQQAGTAMLAQANQLPQGVLALLRG